MSHPTTSRSATTPASSTLRKPNTVHQPPYPALPAPPPPCAAREKPAQSRRPSRQPECTQITPRASFLAIHSGERNAAYDDILGLETTSWQEKAALARPSRDIPGSAYGADPEKGSYHHYIGQGSQRSSHSHIMTSITYNDDDSIGEERLAQEGHALKILLFMSGPCVMLSLVNAVWTCVAVTIAILSQPLRLGTGNPTFGQYLAGLLGPALKCQLRCIYAALPATGADVNTLRTSSLVGIHLLSPILSFAVMFASWTLAIYWASSAIVGDPAGQDKRDDGKETVLGLRSWWERWLMRSFENF